MFNTKHYKYHIISSEDAKNEYPIMSFVFLIDAKETFKALGLFGNYVVKDNDGVDVTPAPQPLQASDTPSS